MKAIFCFASALLLTACSSQKTAKYREAPTPKYSHTKDYQQKPTELRPIVEQILEKRMKASDPTAEGELQSKGIGKIATPWVYGTSRDKYLLVDFNGVPKRIPLKVRRKYEYDINASVAGSLVDVKVEEEIEELDKKTGSVKGWKSVAPDRALYQELLADLDLALRSH